MYLIHRSFLINYLHIISTIILKCWANFLFREIRTKFQNNSWNLIKVTILNCSSNSALRNIYNQFLVTLEILKFLDILKFWVFKVQIAWNSEIILIWQTGKSNLLMKSILIEFKLITSNSILWKFIPCGCAKG